MTYAKHAASFCFFNIFIHFVYSIYFIIENCFFSFFFLTFVIVVVATMTNGGGGNNGAANRTEELQPHPVKEQLPGIQYCVNSPPPWRMFCFIKFWLFMLYIIISMCVCV